MTGLLKSRFERLSAALLAGGLLFGSPALHAQGGDAHVSVTLTAPAADGVFAASASVVVSAAAQAQQKEHPVARVDFYAGSTLIGTATAAPG